MRDEVEEFLRRVAQMRAQAEAQARAAQQRPAQQRPAQQPPPQPQRPQPQPPRLAPQREEVMYLSPDEVEIIDAEVADSDRLRNRPQAFGSAAATAERARQSAAEASLADDRMGVHLHEAFDQSVGQIHQSTDLAASAPSDAKRTGFTAGSIVEMLRSPENIRNAIILGEVLRRPDER